MIAIFSFGLFSLLCGLATSLLQLICFRTLQGIAGALLVPVGRLLMLRVFPKQELVTGLSVHFNAFTIRTFTRSLYWRIIGQ